LGARPRNRPAALRIGLSPRRYSSLMETGGFMGLARARRPPTPRVKAIGLHKVPIALDPEIEVAITINVARSDDEPSASPRRDLMAQREESPVMAPERGVEAAGVFERRRWPERKARSRRKAPTRKAE